MCCSVSDCICMTSFLLDDLPRRAPTTPVRRPLPRCRYPPAVMPTYQSVTSEDRIDVLPHVERARDALRAAELLVGAGLAADAATRAHQACVHAERALLAVEKR